MKKTIYIPILNNAVFVRIGGKTSDFLKEFKKFAKDDDIDGAKEIENGEEMAGWTGLARKKGVVGIWLEKNNKSVFVHEAVHGATFLLKWAGIKADIENDEMIAYLSEYIYERFYNKFISGKSGKNFPTNL
jgi:hypothetical protein